MLSGRCFISRISFLAFPASGVAQILWLTVPFSSGISLTSTAVVISRLSVTLLSPSYKDPCDNLKPIHVIQDSIPSQDPYLKHNCTIPFAMEGDIDTSQGLSMWTSLRAIILSTIVVPSIGQLAGLCTSLKQKAGRDCCVL